MDGVLLSLQTASNRSAPILKTAYAAVSAASYYYPHPQPAQILAADNSPTMLGITTYTELEAKHGVAAASEIRYLTPRTVSFPTLVADTLCH